MPAMASSAAAADGLMEATDMRGPISTSPVAGKSTAAIRDWPSAIASSPRSEAMRIRASSKFLEKAARSTAGRRRSVFSARLGPVKLALSNR
jgi:hypothetical protein